MGLAKKERELAKSGEGCLGKAADDEPVFILRAKDKYAPEVVEYWAKLVESGRVQTVGGYTSALNPACDPSTGKIKEARACAHTMRAWQELNGSKRPD